MSAIATLALAAGLTLVEVELREVTQTVVPAGSVSTAQARIRPVGGLLRLSPGGMAQWHVDWGPGAPPPAAAPPGAVLLRLQAPPAPGEVPRATPDAVVVRDDAPRSRWDFQARLLSVARGEARLALAWRRDNSGSREAAQVEQRMRLDHWTVVSRERPGNVPPAGSVSTQPLAEVRELQMRVREVRQ